MRLSTVVACLLLTFGCSGYDNGVGSCPAPADLFANARHMGVVELDYSEEAPVVGAVRGITVDPRGIVYVLTPTELFSFDKGGRYLWHLPSGRGPGEISSPRGLALVKGELVFANNGGSRIDFVSRQGRYLRSLQAEEYGYSRLSVRGVLGDSLVVLSASVPNRAFAVSVLLVAGDTGSAVDTFVFDATADTDQVRGIRMPPSVGVVKNKIVVSNPLRYELVFLTAAGDTTRIVSRNVPEYTRIGVINRDGDVGARVFSGVGLPVELSDERYLVYTFWPTNLEDPDEFMRLLAAGMAPPLNVRRAIDVYDAEWCFLGSISPPEFDGVQIEAVLASGGPQKLLAETTSEGSILEWFHFEVEDLD